MSDGILGARHRGSSAGLVVVGGGVAGLRVVQAVRQEGYAGPVTLLAGEPHLPYDRPPLSKQVLQGHLAPEATEYHAAGYYAELGVDVRVGVTARGLDTERHRLQLDGHEDVEYAALVVATGSRPRRLPFATPAEGLHVLRTREDAVALRADLEVASTAATLGIDVTIVETAPTPLVRAVGATVGRELAELHETAGVKLICGKAVTGYVGGDRVERLTLDDGSILDVDLVLVGVGVVPDVEWLVGSGLRLGDGMVCDAYLSTGVESVFGAGDAVCWPSARLGRRARSQQWTTASDQGRHVGRLLVLGPSAVGPFDHDLYFWSDQYGARVQGVGTPVGQTVVLSRERTTRSFLAAFRDGDRIVGAVGTNVPRDFNVLRRLVARDAPWSDVEGIQPTVPDLTGGAR
jgi:3-phenylpropionate/trans-cinnamate dioxygenase ferredoxin reductase subunit